MDARAGGKILVDYKSGQDEHCLVQQKINEEVSGGARNMEKNVMVDEIETQPAPQTTLTDVELRALAYFAVGVGSEGSIGGRDVSNRLSFAGTIRNGVMDPVGNSGYTIGTLQTDFGAHPEAAVQLVHAYQAWARTNHQDWVLTDAQRTQTANDLGRNGHAIEVQNGRPLDANVKSHVDSFLASDAGITFVHDRDLAQIDTLMRSGGAMDQLRGTALYQNSSLDEQAKLATVVLKLENQGGQGYYPRIINGINNGTIGSVEDARNMVDGFMPNRTGPNRNGPDYIESGMDHAQDGTKVFNSLRNADKRSPFHQPWQSVLANPLVNPTQTDQDAAHPNLSSEYTAVKDLFLQKGNAPALIAALDQGGAYGYNITNSRGQSRAQSTSLYASGDDFVVMDGNGVGKAYVGGAWSDVDRASLTRVNNRDGTVDLNINRNGTTERLLHVDPNAPVLRPAQQPAEPAQPLPTEQQGWGPFTPNQVPATTPTLAPTLAPRGLGSSQGADNNERQRMIDADRAPSNAIPGSGPIDPSSVNPSLDAPLPGPASDGRDLDSQRAAPEQQTQGPVTGRGSRDLGINQGDALSAQSPPSRVLADQPGNPSFRDFDLIRTTALASGRWNDEESRSIAASLLKEHAADPLCKRLDNVAVGSQTANGEVNVFGVYSPFGEQAPHFTTRVDGNQASKEPVQSNLEHVEQTKQQAQDIVQQQTLQQNNPAQRGPHLSV